MLKRLRFEEGFCLLVGIGSYWAWASVSMVASLLWKDGPVELSHFSWTVNVVSHCASLGVLLLLARRRGFAPNGRFASRAFPSLVAIGTAMLAAGRWAFGLNALVLAGSFVSGMGTAGMLLMWCGPYSSLLQASDQRLILSGSVIVGMFIALLIPNLPDLAALAVTCLLPFATSACMQRMAKAGAAGRGCEAFEWRFAKSRAPAANPLAPSARQDAERPCKRMVVSVLACCFILALPTGLFQNWYTFAESGETATGWSTILSCVCVLMVLATCLDYLFMEKHGLCLFSRLVIPLVAGGLLALPLFLFGESFPWEGVESGAGVLMLTGYHLFLVYVYTEFGLMAADTKTEPCLVFAGGTCTIDIGLASGSMLAAVVLPLPGVWATGAALGIAYLLLLIGVLLFPKALENIENRERDKAFAKSLQANADEPVDPLRDLEGRCANVAAGFGLSAREKDVLGYLLCGRTLRSIANETFLSYNTVKTHVSHIYQKVGVHSRDELIDLLDSADR
ncbi:hypothetical protein B5F40_13020 [Gordonibacter sp. An230]|uniref:helix-turn-helix transcriptional regulator n=1 Tax=Gordonibacter sp. An230 TaxID=1965592 RepID=UPI000B3AC106|nr:helix-turn-helix transcriptional regulator [Gordonibacter sp. An230]OUO87983.1 hypothetical protein B5F40_13020 [Gordonibacter sp. An230]